MPNTIKHSVNEKFFLQIKTPEVAYLLGLIWADGHVKTIGKEKAHRIEVTMLKTDMSELLSVFNKTGKWCIYHRQRPNRKPSTDVITNNRELVEFLQSNDYNIKGFSSADKIISKIPKTLQHYWFRGLIDGDGCFYINPTASQFSITSGYNQNWQYFELLLKTLKIEYGIQKIKRKQGAHSTVRITNREGITKLGDYIYDGYDKHKIGLSRKYAKFLEIKARKLHQSQD